jgi:putative endonuclease
MEVCPGGGIGRHAGLKILWLHGCAGSSPALGTQSPDLIGHWVIKNHHNVSFFYIMFYVYILYSSKIDRYYIGYSENPEKRLLEKHNLGYVKSTKIGVPYILKSKKSFQTEIEAIQEERRLKKANKLEFI